MLGKSTRTYEVRCAHEGCGWSSGVLSDAEIRAMKTPPDGEHFNQTGHQDYDLVNVTVMRVKVENLAEQRKKLIFEEMRQKNWRNNETN